jgi:hypothetical protein
VKSDGQQRGTENANRCYTASVIVSGRLDDYASTIAYKSAMVRGLNLNSNLILVQEKIQLVLEMMKEGEVGIGGVEGIRRAGVPRMRVGEKTMKKQHDGMSIALENWEQMMLGLASG